MQTHGAPAYPLLMLLAALPFLWAGLALCARRLRDAGVSPFWAGVFFLPYLHFAFFLLLAAAPSHSASAPATTAGPYRTPGSEEAPPPSRFTPPILDRLIPIGTGRAFLLGAASTIVAGLLCYVILKQVSKELGVACFIGLPFFAGFSTALAVAYRGTVRIPGAIGYAMATLGIAHVALFALAWEGAVCLLMALPLTAVVTIAGAVAGVATARAVMKVPQVIASLGLVPALALLPLGTVPASVVSEVRVQAPPEVVWRDVVAFPRIDAPPTAAFALAALPLEARVDGEGPGAMRHCIFTTGEFLEPIEIWRPGRELAFGVAAQPPGLDAYLEVTRGRFELVPNLDGSTTVVGTTWYALRLAPVAYWRLWTDALIGAIHDRVLAHIARLSEDPHARARAEAAAAAPPPLPPWVRGAR
jgi:hypothetical protein